MSVDFSMGYSALRLVVEPHAMLDLAQVAIQGADIFGKIGADQTELGRHFQQGQIADIRRQLRMLMRVGEHEILHHELDVHHAAAVVFDVK